MSDYLMLIILFMAGYVTGRGLERVFPGRRLVIFRWSSNEGFRWVLDWERHE